MMRELLLLLLLRQGQARRMTKTLPFRYSGDHNRLCKETFESKERQERERQDGVNDGVRLIDGCDYGDCE